MAGSYRDFLVARGLLQQAAQQPPPPVPSPGLGMGGPIPQTPRPPLTQVPVLRRVQPQQPPVNATPTGGGPMQSQGIPSQGQMAYAAQANRVHGVPGGQPPSGGILNDPLFMQMVAAGATPLDAARLVQQDRASKAQEAQRTQSMTDLANAPGANDPFVSYVAEPVAQAAEAVVTDPVGSAKAIVNAWITVSDIPRQWSVTQIGDQLYAMATSDEVPTWIAGVPGGPDLWRKLQGSLDEGERSAIITAYQNGGGRGVWEDVIAAATDDMPWWLRGPIRAGTDFLVDPLGYPLAVATGGAGVLARGATESATAGNAARAAVESIAARAAGAPQRILDYTIDAPFNAIGDIVGRGISALRGGRLLDEAAEEVVEDTRSGVGEAVTGYERAIDDLPPVASVADAPSPGTVADAPAPTSGRYTKVEMEIPGKGTRWVILDPQGNPVEDLEWRPVRATDTEPNYAARVADKRVNELNRPAEVAGLETADVIVPPESWKWMDPTQNRLTTAGADRTSRGVLSTVVFDRRTVPAPVARQIVDDLTPAVQNHVQLMDDIGREVDAGIKRAGFSGEDAVQRGTDLADPRKTREMVRFYAEDVLPTWRRYMGDVEPDPYVFRYGDTLDTTNINNVIEHAVFGTNEQAIAARKFLRANRVFVGDDITSVQLAQQASDWRKALFGEQSLSQDPTAVKSRRVRQNRALEPVPNEAALREMGLAPIDQPTLVERGAPGGSPIPSPSPEVAAQIERELAKPKPRRTRTAKRTKQTLDLRTLTDVDAVRLLDDPDLRFETPGGFRIERAQARRYAVYSSRRADRDVPSVLLTPQQRGGWLVETDGGATRLATTDTFGEAVAVADWHLGGRVAGGEPVGIVPAAVRRNLAMEPDINRSILRNAGALEGAGGDAIADTSPIGQLVNRGAIDRETYARLATPVEFEGQVIPLYQAYDMLVLQTGDPTAAKRLITSMVAPLDGETFKSAAKAKKLLIAYDKSLQVLREQMQYNVARGGAAALADQVGNSYTLLITGRPVEALRIWNPHSWLRFYGNERGGREILDHLPGMDRLQRLNVTPPGTVTQLHLGRTETGAGQMVLREGMQQVGMTGRVSGTIYGAFANKTIRDFRNALDRNARWALFVGDFDRTLDANRIRFYGMVQERARKLGKNGVETDLWVQATRELGDTFTPEDVRRVLGDERLARDWRQLISDAKKVATDSVNERLFSYRQTNADALLRRVVFFHYWQSRAFILHSRTTLQNPWLLNTYVRAWENLKQEAEERNYPDSIKGYLNVMGGPNGFYGLLNPLGVLVPFTMLTEAAREDDNAWDWIKRHGLFINPILEGAATALGWSDQPPDLTGSRAVRRAVLATINALNASDLNRLAPGGANTYQPDQIDAFTAKVYEIVNRYAGRLPIPGTGDIDPGNTAGYEMDQLNSVLIQLAEDQWGPMETWGEAEWTEYTAASVAIQTGQDGNDLADDAIEQFTEARFAGTLASVIVPGGINVRYGPRDTDIAAANAGYDALDAGMQPAPEQQAGMDHRSAATAGGEADLTLDWQADAYREMGTDRQRSLSDGWNSIAFGPDANVPDYYVIDVGGTEITAGDLRALSKEDRMAFADAWVASVDGTAELESYRAERKQFIADNPEYGQFEEWKDLAYGEQGYNGDLRAFRTDRAAGNPAFRQAMAAQEKTLRERGTDASVIPDELDQWAASLAGYKAAQGIRTNIYDAERTDTGDQGTVNTILRAGGGGSGGGGSSAPKSTSAKLREDMAEYQKAVAVFDQVLAGAVIEGGFANINNPLAIRSLQAQFGDIMPSMSSLMRQYLEWVDAVSRSNPNADTSPEAFARVLDAMKAAA